MFDIAILLNSYGYVAMLSIAMIENGIFFMLPGDSMLIAAGILASADKFNLYITIVMFAVGGFLGNLIGYEIGKKLEIWRENIQKKNKHTWLLKIFKDEYIKEAHYAFNKYGDKIVLIQRYIPMMRTFAPMVAGMVKMKYRKYVTYSIIGSLLWSVSLVMPAYWLGNSIPGIGNHIEAIVFTILGVTTLPIVYQLIKRYIKRRSMI